MMNATQPPTKTKEQAKAPPATGAAKTSGGEKKPSKPRGPRKDYGFNAGSTIKLTDGEKNYRGQRLDWYKHLAACNGKTVADFLEASKGMKDPGRGWLRFFVQDEACTLTPPPPAPEEQKKAA
jgi:hypothetical protein